MPKELTQITIEFLAAEETAADEGNVTKPGEDTMQPQRKGRRGRKKIKDLDAETENIEVPDDEILFQKQYYSIGEVASMFKVKTSLLRYWEKEFDIIDPRKNRKGDRFFKPIDIKNLQLIHDLLRRRKFTIEGAKEYLKKARRVREKHEMIQSLQKLKAFLLELRANL